MEGVKKQLKRVLPASVLKRIVNPYHWGESVIANIANGFPARDMQVVIVTGTNGKTTTVGFIGSVLTAAGYKVGICSTAYFEINGERIANDLNFTVTNPFKLQTMLARMKQAGVEYLVLEVTSHALMQHRTWGIPCEVAVMTNLTQDHLDYHGTMENYAAAKGRLFARKPKYVVLNRDDQWFDFFNKYEAGEQKITYGTDEAADVRIAKVRLHKEGSAVSLKVDQQVDIEFAIRMTGKFNVYNAAAAAATAYVMRVDVEHIVAGLEALEGIPGRQEYINEGQPFDVIVDYAHTPDALENLFETLKHLSKKRLIVVFGATGDRDKAKRPIMGEVAAKYADHMFVTDDESYSEDPAAIRTAILDGINKAGASDKTTEQGDRREAIKQALAMAKRGDTVVVTGMGHEHYRIVDGKRQPWHEPTVVRELLAEN